MDPGFLDVLHDRRDERVVPSQSASTSISIAPSRKLSISTRPPTRGGRGDRLIVVTDLHVPSTEDVRGADEHRIPDRLCDVGGMLGSLGHGPGGHCDLELVAERGEPLAILGEVDGIEGRPEDPPAFCLDFARKFQRGLTPELDDDAIRELARADLEHFLGAERLEVEAVDVS